VVYQFKIRLDHVLFERRGSAVVDTTDFQELIDKLKKEGVIRVSENSTVYLLKEDRKSMYWCVNERQAARIWIHRTFGS